MPLSSRIEVPLTSKWVPVRAPGVVEASDRASELSRGCRASRWPVPTLSLRRPTVHWRRAIVVISRLMTRIGKNDRRFCAATVRHDWRLELGPDAHVRRIAHTLCFQCHNGGDGSLATRQGGAVGWRAAQRIDVTISNNSGCCGAALSRRRFGETLRHIKRFPHWWGAGFDRFIDNEDALPVDQHQLLALCATGRRRVYVAVRARICGRIRAASFSLGAQALRKAAIIGDARGELRNSAEWSRQAIRLSI
jgi:hypothetical protein